MNGTFWELFEADMHRYGGAKTELRRLHYYLRKAQTSKNVMNYMYRFLLHREERKRGIEISYKVNIGPGLYLGHAYGITVNDNALLGKNCNLHKGVTIGRENRGKRKGAPVLGDNVWVGINAVVVGNISIGSNVLIAPNAFVNVDVPDNSVVIGNPCIIVPKDHATESYINNTI